MSNPERIPYVAGPAPTAGERAESLFAQAREAAAEDLEALAEEGRALQAHVTRIADAGDVYAPAYRELCRTLATHLGGWLEQIATAAARSR